MSYKILISCYACSPYEGSEPGMGWNFVSKIASDHEVHVITEQKFQKDLERKRNESPEQFMTLHFYYIRRIRHKILRKIWPPSYYWSYRQWQKKAYHLAMELDNFENFQIIHQLNMVGFREPGYLWKLKKPFVWGPVGGMENTSVKLLLNLNPKDFAYLFLRNIINSFQKKFSKRPKKAATRLNSSVIAATTAIHEGIKKHWQKESTIIPEVGQVPVSTPVFKNRSEHDSFIILWSGQHEAGKALNVLLRSLKQVSEEINWRLSILGSGPLTENWKDLSRKYKIDQRCDWHGWINLEKAHLKMQEAHIVCITSLKDLTSTLTLEALSFGLPVICIDHCGFSNVINPECGIKLSVDYPAKLSNNFARAIERLYYDEPLRQKMSQGAYKRSLEYSWDIKLTQLNKIYNSLLIP